MMKMGGWGTMSASVIALAIAAPVPAYAQQQQFTFNIPAQSLDSALRAFARTSRQQVLFDGALVRGKRSAGFKGQATADEALRALLASSGLEHRLAEGGAYVVSASAVGNASAAAEAASSGEEAVPEAGEATAEILVVGSRTQNVDIRRTEDDIQPYVVFDSDQIERSGATSIEEFLRTRLPMVTQRVPSNQLKAFDSSNAGRISLRGLGADQTLILVDGRRLPGVGLAEPNALGQPNISGISTQSIERIEILPSTAGGIYGGGAVGGVINIILKRNYRGLDLRVGGGHLFEGHQGRFQVDLNGGVTFRDGTRVMVTASHMSESELDASDRNFRERSLELVWENNPASFLGSLPPLAEHTNVCAASFSGSTACATTILTLDPAFGGASLGSNILSIPAGYQGLAVDGASPLLSSAGAFNFRSAKKQSSLLTGSKANSFRLNARRNFGDLFEAYVDIGLDKHEYSSPTALNASYGLAADDPENPFQQPISVNVVIPNVTQNQRSELTSKGIRGGGIVHLGHHWSVVLEHGWTKTTSSSRIKGQHNFAVGTPGLNYLKTVALRDLKRFPPDVSALGDVDHIQSGPYDTSLNDTTLRASGALFRLPGGRATITSYLERRDENLSDGYFESIPGGSSGLVRYYAPKSRDVRSYYLEGRFPIISGLNHVPLFHDLELFGSIRRDKYETRAIQGPAGGGFSVPERGDLPAVIPEPTENKFGSTDFTVGAKYAPIEDIVFRASYGTGFLPPNLGQIVSVSSNINLFFLRDPLRNNQPIGLITWNQGGNPDLKPEESKSLSAGFVVTPRFAKGLRLSVDYTRINKKDEIQSLGLNQLLVLEAQFPDRVIRLPLTPADISAGFTTGKISVLDTRAINVSETKVRALDMQLDYEIDLESLGIIRPYAIATHQNVLARRIFPTDPMANYSGHLDGPVEWRGNFGAVWERKSWRVGWDAQYIGPYSICSGTPGASCASSIASQGKSRVAARIYNDLFVGYTFNQSGSSMLSGVQLMLGIQNILNQSPPILASDTFDPYGDPRLRRFTVNLTKHIGK